MVFHSDSSRTCHKIYIGDLFLQDLGRQYISVDLESILCVMEFYKLH